MARIQSNFCIKVNDYLVKSNFENNIIYFQMELGILNRLDRWISPEALSCYENIDSSESNAKRASTWLNFRIGCNIALTGNIYVLL